MVTEEYLLNRYNIDPNTQSPINLPFRRDELGNLFKDLGFKIGAEIGVDRGLYSQQLCTLNPDMKLYCIDPWKVYDAYDEKQTAEDFVQRYNETVERLKPYNCEIIKKSSEGAVKDFQPESLDFVYIDGNHSYKYALEDINMWSKIVKKGGIIAGHDYRSSVSSHGKWDVTKAVHEYMDKHGITKLFIFVRRVDSSWMFINQ